MPAHSPARSLAEQFAPALARRGVAHASLFGTVRGGALALSLFAHVAIVAVGLHEAGAAAPRAPTPRAALAEVPAPELEPVAPAAEPEERAAQAAPARLVEHVSHAAVARAPSAPPAAPHSVTLPPFEAPAPPEPLVTTTESAAPRFVLADATVQAALNTAPRQGPSVALGTASAPLPEREVDVAARLVAGEPPAYPPTAEAAGVEASVPVELVIDETGAVKSAVVLTHVGYGLDEAALAAVQKYRFSPARRAGKAVSVRMRWLVRFELG